jgi:hypothetical protein
MYKRRYNYLSKFRQYLSYPASKWDNFAFSEANSLQISAVIRHLFNFFRRALLAN